MNSKAIKAVTAAAVFAIAGYWYWSPFLTIRQLQTAAQAKDADSFNERVDYPKLRESLKGQFSALIAEKMGNTVDVQNPFTALGTALSLVMVNQMVESMVRPEVVMQAMRNGKVEPSVKPQRALPATDQPASPVDPASTAPAEQEKPKWTYERKGVDKLLAYAVDPKNPGAPNTEKVGLMFERSGFANWKLTELRLPAQGK
jgi:hypothetical protein